VNSKEKQTVIGSYTKSSHVYSQVSITHTHTHITSIYYRTYITSDHMSVAIFISYVSEHQLPHAANTSHTTPTTHAKWGPI